MPSLVPGFECDIFISYRHNDNRSGWVTDFVEALQVELAATIKEPLSIYFDKNPHNGLLETHNVDKSLEGKLKCLIFIPIISQTYCDTKSFAWQHEFCAFNKLAKDDELGREIKLSNGNVASRILPIKIHDLDAEDKATIENEIGGVLRAIEFIYKEPGVNRPLKLSDDRINNLSKTDYRNQINKVANAVKELIQSVAHPEIKSAKIFETNPSKKKHTLLLTLSLVLLASLFAGYFIWTGTRQESSKNKFDNVLDRAEKLLEEFSRFQDVRYSEQAFRTIQDVLAKDSVNERALSLLVSMTSDADTSEFFIRKLSRLNPTGIYTLTAKAGRLLEKQKWAEAKLALEDILKREPDNKDALSMICFMFLTTQDYKNCFLYTKKLETVNAKTAHEILSNLFLELGDFKEAYRQLELKQALQEFACVDVENFQKILLCEGNFKKLEKLTDSLCNFSKCLDCDFWKLRAKAHLGKYQEAARLVGPSLKRMSKITWRNMAFVLLKNGKKDSARLIADAEIEFDRTRLADTTYNQSIPLYSMAAIYAMQGKGKESIDYLRQYASRGFEMGSEWYIAHDPLFDDLQKDNEFFADFLPLFQKEQQRKTAIREQLRTIEN